MWQCKRMVFGRNLAIEARSGSILMRLLGQVDTILSVGEYRNTTSMNEAARDVFVCENRNQ